MPTWSDKEAQEPFDYWQLSSDKTGFPRRWKAKGFSHRNTRVRHFEDHGASVGAKDETDYENKARGFLMSPRGKHGDAYIRDNGDVCRYDYDNGIIAIGNKEGTIKSFWGIASDRGQKNARRYWEEGKRKDVK